MSEKNIKSRKKVILKPTYIYVVLFLLVISNSLKPVVRPSVRLLSPKKLEKCYLLSRNSHNKILKTKIGDLTKIRILTFLHEAVTVSEKKIRAF